MTRIAVVGAGAIGRRPRPPRPAPIAVGHHRRHNRLIARARALIDDGRLGRVLRGEEPPVVSGRDGLAALAVIEAVKETASPAPGSPCLRPLERPALPEPRPVDTAAAASDSCAAAPATETVRTPR